MLSLTATEAAALTGMDERAVRKDVEHGILDAGSPPRFAEVALVYLRACASFAFRLSAKDRGRLYEVVADAMERRVTRLELGPGWFLDVAAIASEMRERVAAFEIWREELVVSDDILGGEPVFPNSRLAVRRVGEMRGRGRGVESAEILKDYPYLSARDIEFACLFTVAYPRIGRPRAQAPA